MFYKKEKKLRHIGEKTFKKLKDEDKEKTILNIKNRAKLRHFLAVYITDQPFEDYIKHKLNIIEIGLKFFEKNPEETLIIEDWKNPEEVLKLQYQKNRNK